MKAKIMKRGYKELKIINKDFMIVLLKEECNQVLI
jgi:hypothetical protein